MKKSEIIVAVVVRRTEKTLQEKQLLREVNNILTELSTTFDHDIDAIIAEGIIKHMGSVRGELTLRDLIVDIDLILKRITRE